MQKLPTKPKRKGQNTSALRKTWKRIRLFIFLRQLQLREIFRSSGLKNKQRLKKKAKGASGAKANSDANRRKDELKEGGQGDGGSQRRAVPPPSSDTRRASVSSPTVRPPTCTQSLANPNPVPTSKDRVYSTPAPVSPAPPWTAYVRVHTTFCWTARKDWPFAIASAGKLDGPLARDRGPDEGDK